MQISTLTMPEALSRLHRHFIGSDTMFDLGFDMGSGFPPHNIEKLSDDSYRLTLALAGYRRDQLSVEVENMTLTITGKKAQQDPERVFLHRGIADRDFKREFRLMENTFVIGADYNDGLLTINIRKEIPEHVKAKQIKIA